MEEAGPLTGPGPGEKTKGKRIKRTKARIGTWKVVTMPPCLFLTPQGGLLARRMKDKEAENNQGRKIRFKIIEKGGVSLDQKLRRSNPWAGEKWGRPRCFPCKRAIATNNKKRQDIARKFANKYRQLTFRQYWIRFSCYFHWNTLLYDTVWDWMQMWRTQRHKKV